MRQNKNVGMVYPYLYYMLKLVFLISNKVIVALQLMVNYQFVVQSQQSTAKITIKKRLL